MLKIVVCKFKGHILKEAGQCPYTGSVYDVCTRCAKLIKTPGVNNVEI